MLCLRPERYFRGKIKGFMEDLGEERMDWKKGGDSHEVIVVEKRSSSSRKAGKYENELTKGIVF